jgi:hypothetical protein
MRRLPKVPLAIATGPDPHLDAAGAGARPRPLRRSGDGVGAVRIAVRISARPVLTGDGQFALDELIVPLEFLIGKGQLSPTPSSVFVRKSEGWKRGT